MTGINQLERELLILEEFYNQYFNETYAKEKLDNFFGLENYSHFDYSSLIYSLKDFIKLKDKVGNYNNYTQIINEYKEIGKNQKLTDSGIVANEFIILKLKYLKSAEEDMLETELGFNGKQFNNLYELLSTLQDEANKAYSIQNKNKKSFGIAISPINFL